MCRIITYIYYMKRRIVSCMIWKLIGIGIAGGLIKSFAEKIEELREKEQQRRGTPCYFEDGVSEERFWEIVKNAAKKVGRIKTISVDGTKVYGVAESKSGVLEQEFELDFNDYGHITGKYWIYSNCNDSEVPNELAKHICKDMSDELYDNSICKQTITEIKAQKKERKKRKKLDNTIPENSKRIKVMQKFRKFCFFGSALLLVEILYYGKSLKQLFYEAISFETILSAINLALLILPVLYFVLLIITTSNTHKNKLINHIEQHWIVIFFKTILKDLICPIIIAKDFVRAVCNSYPPDYSYYEIELKRKQSVISFVLMIVCIVIYGTVFLLMRNNGNLQFDWFDNLAFPKIEFDYNIIIICLVIINIVAFILFTVDYIKYKRTGSGFNNYIICHIGIICGGALGALMAIILFDRKYIISVKGRKAFLIYVCIMFFIQAGLVFAFFGPFKDVIINKIDSIL